MTSHRDPSRGGLLKADKGSKFKGGFGDRRQNQRQRGRDGSSFTAGPGSDAQDAATLQPSQGTWPAQAYTVISESKIWPQSAARRISRDLGEEGSHLAKEGVHGSISGQSRDLSAPLPTRHGVGGGGRSQTELHEQQGNKSGPLRLS